MDDWDLYVLNNKLNGIKAEHEKINHNLESLKNQRYSSSPRDRIFSAKTKGKIILGIVIGALVIDVLVYVGIFILSIIYKF